MKIQKSNLGIPIVVVFTLAPLFLWLSIMPLTDRTRGVTTVLTSLGQVAGLVGLALFAASLVLSSRQKLVENFFGGVNRAYVIHHILGGLSFSLLLLHPTILIIRYMYFSYGSALKLLFDFSNLPVIFGQLAIFTMSLLLIVTLFIKLPYHIWKISHQFLGLAFLFATLHTLLISSDVARDPILRGYMIFVLVIGLAAFDYKTIFGRYLIKKHRYSLVEVTKRGSNIIDITLKPETQNLKFISGQFAFISVQNSRLSTEQHPFSFSSAPSEKTVTFSIKNLGDFTGSLINVLNPGDQFIVEGPYGRFCHLLGKFDRQVWVGAGIGITPFLSMAKNLEDKYQVDCYYCVKNQAEAIYLDDLIINSRRSPNLRIIPYYSESLGRIDVKSIKKTSGNLSECDFFICGPGAMTQSLRSQLIGTNVKNYAIHTEEFNF